MSLSLDDTTGEMTTFTLQTADGAQGRAFEFSTPHVSIGRDRGADFTLDHPTVSRQHAVVAWDGQAYKLVVLSRGGLTAIDGQQVGGEVPLYDGCQLMFGQLAFVFRSQFAPPRPAGQSYPNPQTGVQQPVYGAPGPQFPAASTAGMHASASGIYQAPGQMPSPDATVDFQTAARITGGFPSMAEHEKLAKSQSKASADGLVSWEEIAANADALPAQKDSLTDFHEMQKAQAVADAQNRGTNPMVVMGGIVAVGLVFLLFVYGGDTIVKIGQEPEVVEAVDLLEPMIAWRKSDVDCIGVAQCREQAIGAFNIGKVMLERQEADIINLNDGFMQLERATELLAKENIDPPPTEMKGVKTMKAEAAAAMRSRFLRERANYFAQEDYKDYKKMATILNRLKAYFPDERLNYHLWALKQITAMKNDNVYPTEREMR